MENIYSPTQAQDDDNKMGITTPKEADTHAIEMTGLPKPEDSEEVSQYTTQFCSQTSTQGDCVSIWGRAYSKPTKPKINIKIIIIIKIIILCPSHTGLQDTLN